MRPKSLILLVLALGCGLVASIGISQVMDRRGSRKATIETEPIYIAKVDINLSDRITAEFVKLDEWPKAKLPRGAMKNIDDLLERRPRTKIYEGEPILERKLRAKNAADDPSQQIPKGYRVVPVRVGSDTGGSGLIGPGDRVDVQLFVKRKRGSGLTQTMVRTILTNIRVFAVNKQFRRSLDSGDDRVVAKTVALLLKPQDANKLTLASKLGQIKMIIRNPEDTESQVTQNATIQDIFGTSGKNSQNRERGASSVSGSKTKSSFADWLARAQQAAATTKSKNAPWRVEVLEGPHRREVLFDEQGHAIRSSGKRPSYEEPISTPSASKDKPAKENDTANKSDKKDEADAYADESEDMDGVELTEDDLILPDDPPED